MAVSKEDRNQLAADVCDDLASLGEVRARAMFGGHGVFAGDVMFAMVDSSGTVRLRASEDTRARYIEAGTEPMGRMPYWEVPRDVLAESDRFLEWATEALGVSQAAKKAKAPRKGKKESS